VRAQVVQPAAISHGYDRWNGDTDYNSNGCLKLKPADTKDLFARLDPANRLKNLTRRVS
jgi:hypothetical protein